ncbi:MAG TPA: tRNA pseudouridine(13) synthase TruD [Micromonosporaceae bacterium]|nr:tRNA pseudouridine(13) synthase TruD [Micromonosporaceae bacterium]HCU48457.1 tRNA pseudouridine(13) synthase TruD [Micromonosporaceae bacterium]
MPTDLMTTPVLKFRPEDFLVFESAAVRMSDGAPGPYQYLRLRKRGFTTFDGVAAMASFGKLERRSVTYAGLKDEDAITEQLVCVSMPGGAYPVEDFNAAHCKEDGTYLSLIPYGTGDQPLDIGRLDGNSFRVVVRNLTGQVSEALAGRRHNHLFVNYYDTQRFGVPGGPRVTHLIGAQLLGGDPAAALQLVAGSGATESESARMWARTADEFFAALDVRLRSFYLSAHASDCWNQDLATLLGGGIGETVSVQREGISFLFATDRNALAELACQWPEFAYRKYRANGDADIEPANSTRPTIVQTQISAGPAEPDEAYPGQHKCEISMFLPSGCYATTAVAQLLTCIESNVE